MRPSPVLVIPSEQLTSYIRTTIHRRGQMTKRKILREMTYRDRRRAERRQLQSVVLSGWSASLIDQEVRQGTWLDPYMAILKIPIR